VDGRGWVEGRRGGGGRWGKWGPGNGGASPRRLRAGGGSGTPGRCRISLAAMVCVRERVSECVCVRERERNSLHRLRLGGGLVAPGRLGLGRNGRARVGVLLRLHHALQLLRGNLARKHPAAAAAVCT
jgi:hypothetical protein